MSTPQPEKRYRTTCHWYPYEPDAWEQKRGLPGHQPEPFVETHSDLYQAERQGGRFGCMSGIRRVEVHSIAADGTETLQALWDKESTEVIQKSYGLDEDGNEIVETTHVSSLWQQLGEESRAMHRAEHEVIAAAMREGLTTFEAAARLKTWRAQQD